MNKETEAILNVKSVLGRATRFLDKTPASNGDYIVYAEDHGNMFQGTDHALFLRFKTLEAVETGIKLLREQGYRGTIKLLREIEITVKTNVDVKINEKPALK